MELGRHSGRPRHEPLRLQGHLRTRLCRAAVPIRGVCLRVHGSDAVAQAECFFSLGTFVAILGRKGSIGRVGNKKLLVKNHQLLYLVVYSSNRVKI